jgi:hypothetical protein
MMNAHNDRQSLSLTSGPVYQPHVSLGIWFKPTVRFSFFSSQKVRFLTMKHRLVFS